MPDIHVPHLDEDEDEPALPPPASTSAARPHRQHSLLKIDLLLKRYEELLPRLDKAIGDGE